MKVIKDGERLAALETNMENVQDKLNTMENSIQGLHGKFDSFINTITTNYVVKDTFEEWKKNRWLERIVIIIITAIISGLIAFFLRANNV